MSQQGLRYDRIDSYKNGLCHNKACNKRRFTIAIMCHVTTRLITWTYCDRDAIWLVFTYIIHCRVVTKAISLPPWRMTNLGIDSLLCLEDSTRANDYHSQLKDQLEFPPIFESYVHVHTYRFHGILFSRDFSSLDTSNKLGHSQDRRW